MVGKLWDIDNTEGWYHDIFICVFAEFSKFPIVEGKENYDRDLDLLLAREIWEKGIEIVAYRAGKS